MACDSPNHTVSTTGRSTHASAASNSRRSVQPALPGRPAQPSVTEIATGSTSAGGAFAEVAEGAGVVDASAPLSLPASFFGLLVAVVKAKKPAITSTEPT